MENLTKNIVFWRRALTLLFITLRLADIIQWSWLWVLSPYWIVIIAAILLLALENLINRYLD